MRTLNNVLWVQVGFLCILTCGLNLAGTKDPNALGRLSTIGGKVTTAKGEVYLHEMIDKRIGGRGAQVEKDIEKRLELLKSEICRIDGKAQTNEKEIDRHLSTVSFYTGIVFALVGIMLAIGWYRSYTDHKDVMRKTREMVEKQFSPWLKDQEDKCIKQAQEMHSEHRRRMWQMTDYLTLRHLLHGSHPTAEEVYPLVTTLYSAPQLEHASVFKKLVDLDIDPDITAKAKEALKKLGRKQKV